MHQLLPILEKALARRVVLPQRKIENFEAFIKSFPELKDFINRTERRVERSSNNKKQRLDYSNKKTS